MKKLRLILQYAKRYWWQYILGLAALTVVDAFNALVPRITGEITDSLAAGAGIDHIVTLVLRILLMGGIIAIGRFFWRYCLIGSSRAIEKDIRNDLYAHLETLDPAWYNDHKTGDLMAHFSNDLQIVREMCGINIITTFDASVMLIIVLYNMVRYVSMKLTIVALIPLVLIIFGDMFYGKIMNDRFMIKQEAFSKLTDMTQEAVSGIRVIKAFVQEKKQFYAFRKMCLECKEKNLSVVNLMALVYPLLDLVIGVSSLATLLYGGYLAILGEISVGQFIAFNGYVNMLVWPMIAAGECVTGMSQGMASWTRIVNIMEQNTWITDAEADKSITSLQGHIHISDLSFTYPTGSVPAVSGLNVDVPVGSTLAIIGRTGSGKTTIVNLLERLWDCEPGTITIDGHPLRKIPLKVLRSSLAVVPQDSILFSATVSGNIGFAMDEWTQEQVEQAAKDACIHDNIVDFPKGYETVVGERGVTLSGGQKQRTAIARALLCDAPVLLLDDALSAVDTDTEESILRNLHRLREGKTTVIVAHRISTIQHADQILVMDDGKMVELGSHEELMALHGVYRSIWEKQQLERALNEEGGEEQ